MDRQVGRRANPTYVVRERCSEPGSRLDLAAQVEDRKSELRDHAGEFRSKLMDRLTQLRVVSCLSGKVIQGIAERGQLLGDAVMDFPCQPASFLDGGYRAHLGEQQRGVEPKGTLFRNGGDTFNSLAV